MRKHIASKPQIKKRGKRHAVEYKGDPGEVPVDMLAVKHLDQYYQHFDQFTKHSIRK